VYPLLYVTLTFPVSCILYDVVLSEMYILPTYMFLSCPLCLQAFDTFTVLYNKHVLQSIEDLFIAIL